MSDLFPRTEVPQVNLTDPARTAAEALAASQSTDIITRIGLLEYICADDFDPSDAAKVTALTGAAATAFASTLVGARCTTVGGTKWWRKFGSGTTQWLPGHAMSGVLGEAATTIDTTLVVANLACDTLGGFKAVFQGLCGNSAQYFTPQLNGADMVGCAIGVAGNTAATAFTTTNAALFLTTSAAVAANGRFTVEIECDSPASGNRYRIIKFNSVYNDNQSSITRAISQVVNTTMPIAEVVSVGIKGVSIDASSTVTITR